MGFGFFVGAQAPTVFGAGRAVKDSANTAENTPVKVNVTRNDTGFNTKDYEIEIVRKPRKGEVRVGSDKRIEYSPDANFHGRDRVLYRLTDNLGYNSKATLTVTVESASTGSSAGDAMNDSARTNKGKIVKVDVAKNDSGFNNRNYAIAIVRKPRKGEASVGSDKQIRYTPDADFVGKDTVIYRLTDNRGYRSKATLTVTVDDVPKSSARNPVDDAPKSSAGNQRSANSSVNRRLVLQWKPNPKAVDGYIVLFGTKKSNTTLQVSDISVRRGTLDRRSPSVVLFTASDLGIGAGDNACFRLQAYNDGGRSPQSEAVCTTIR